MNILQPTGYDCNYAQGGLSKQAGILYDPNMPVEAGGLLLVAAEMNVERLARMKFYICPREIPDEIHMPWTFDCEDKILLDVSRDYQSSMLDWKLQYYLNISFIQVHIPENFYCNRCGLQIEAEFKKTPNAEPDETETRCSFIHVHEDHVEPGTKPSQTTARPPQMTTDTVEPLSTPSSTTSTSGIIIDHKSTSEIVIDGHSPSPTPPHYTVEPPEIEIAEPPPSLGKSSKKRGPGHRRRSGQKKRKGHKAPGRGGKKKGHLKGKKQRKHH